MASARNKVREKPAPGGAAARATAGGAGSVLQPGALLAAVQPARAGGGAERAPPAARAPALSVDLGLQPRRVLHGARGRHLRPGAGRRADALPGRPDAGAAAARDQSLRGEPRRRQAGVLARAQGEDGGAGHRHPRAQRSARGRARVAAAPVHDAHLSHPDADRRRPGASLSLHPQPGPRHRGRDAARQRRQGHERPDPHPGQLERFIRLGGPDAETRPSCASSGSRR